jgi:hypothetical protein
LDALADVKAAGRSACVSKKLQQLTQDSRLWTDRLENLEEAFEKGKAKPSHTRGEFQQPYFEEVRTQLLYDTVLVLTDTLPSFIHHA